MQISLHRSAFKFEYVFNLLLLTYTTFKCYFKLCRNSNLHFILKILDVTHLCIRYFHLSQRYDYTFCEMCFKMKYSNFCDFIVEFMSVHLNQYKFETKFYLK